MARRDPLEACTGYDWDENNALKIWDRHQVMPEAEAIFFNEPLFIRSDVAHSRREKRYYALGQTDAARWLFVVFTIRASRDVPYQSLLKVFLAERLAEERRRVSGR